MEVSYRHAKRLKGFVARDGPKGLVYDNKGRRPYNAMGVNVRQRVVELSLTQYVFF